MKNFGQHLFSYIKHTFIFTFRMALTGHRTVRISLPSIFYILKEKFTDPGLQQIRHHSSVCEPEGLLFPPPPPSYLPYVLFSIFLLIHFLLVCFFVEEKINLKRNENSPT